MRTHEKFNKDIFFTVNRLVALSSIRKDRNRMNNLISTIVGRNSMPRNVQSFVDFRQNKFRKLDEDDEGSLKEKSFEEMRFIMANLTDSSLYNLILRTLSIHFELDLDPKRRRGSSELLMDGGRVKKLGISLHSEDIKTALRDYYSKKIIQSTHKDVEEFPWILDNNKASLSQSLRCFKRIIGKYAIHHENHASTNSLDPNGGSSARRGSIHFEDRDGVVIMDKFRELLLISLMFKIPMNSNPTEEKKLNTFKKGKTLEEAAEDIPTSRSQDILNKTGQKNSR